MDRKRERAGQKKIGDCKEEIRDRIRERGE